MLSRARTVLAASATMATDVRDGPLSLDKAYAKVKQDAEDSKRLQWDRGRCKCGLPALQCPRRGANASLRTDRNVLGLPRQHHDAPDDRTVQGLPVRAGGGGRQGLVGA